VSHTIEIGSILIGERTALPETLPLESEPYTPGWRLVKNLDADGLGPRIREARWTFFCLAGEIKATAFGVEGQKAVHSAVKRILASLTPGEFNSLEITRVTSKRFLGVPYVTVSARSRHIQDSVFLFRANHLKEWDQATLAA
jgi:hypothetical protein